MNQLRLRDPHEPRIDGATINFIIIFLLTLTRTICELYSVTSSRRDFFIFGTIEADVFLSSRRATVVPTVLESSMLVKV